MYYVLFDPYCMKNKVISCGVLWYMWNLQFLPYLIILVKGYLSRKISYFVQCQILFQEMVWTQNKLSLPQESSKMHLMKRDPSFLLVPYSEINFAVSQNLFYFIFWVFLYYRNILIKKPQHLRVSNLIGPPE